MTKINIKRQDIITHSASFETTELANIWLQQEVNNGSFGKPERWVREGQEDISSALEERLIGGDGLLEEYTEYKLPCEYVIETVENYIDQDKINAEALAYLASTDYLVIRQAETGQAMSEEIMLARQAARNRIIK